MPPFQFWPLLATCRWRIAEITRRRAFDKVRDSAVAIEETSKRLDICSRIDTLSARLFGRHVRRSTHEKGRLRAGQFRVGVRKISFSFLCLDNFEVRPIDWRVFPKQLVQGIGFSEPQEKM